MTARAVDRGVEGDRGGSRWSLERGAQVLPGAGVRFAVWAPYARQVSVELTQAGRDAGATRTVALQPSEAERGVFEVMVPDAEPGDEYTYHLDGAGYGRPDPVSRWLPNGVHCASRIVDPASYRWADHAWRGRSMADLVIYELHVGTFTTAGTFDAAAEDLGRLADLGVTAVEVMPVAQFPGARNWGYDGVSLYAVQNSYGGPDAFKRFVDAAHAAGLAVILDVVYNHLGPEGNYLDEFGPYFTDRYGTPWGRAVNYDDAGSDEVRRYVVDNALYWVSEYHVDGLRLDAVHGIYDFSARHLLRELADAVHAEGERLGRTVVVIAESDLNDPRLIRETARDGFGLDAQWADDFHHAAHALLTGERAGYYEDFGTVRHVARSLEDPFVYQGQHSAYRRRRHGAPAEDIPRDRFVVAIQNHDQVGNRAVGDRLAAIVEPARLRLGVSLLLLSPYVPLVFMGEEYGETNPFLYFVSHGDPELLRAVSDGRRREFGAFDWGDDVPDPASAETFARSRIERAKMERPEHAMILRLYRDLLELRRREPLLRPGATDAKVRSGEPGWITLRRSGGWVAAFNCCAEPCEVPPGDSRENWSLVFSSEDAKYGGKGSCGEPVGGLVSMAPWSAALFRNG